MFVLLQKSLSMYYINKIALLLINPVIFGVVLVALAMVLALRNKSRLCARVLVFVFVWFWFWSSGFSQKVMCKVFSLDKYSLKKIEDLPCADAIVELGGGMSEGLCISNFPYAEIMAPGDRAWHSARLWRANKAPLLLPTGGNVRTADMPLLVALGIPATQILIEEQARNTEENAIFTEKVLLERLQKAEANVLLVTSFSHMRRAMMIFKKCAPHLKCVPVPCDVGEVWFVEPLSLKFFKPSIGALCKNMVVYKECLGIIGYWIRGFRD